MSEPKKGTSIERELCEVFFKSVGAHLGLWDKENKQLRPSATSEAIYQTNLEIVRKALEGRWSYHTINQAIWSAYRRRLKCALISEILPENPPEEKITEETNLIDTKETYHHPALYNRTSPTFVVSDDKILTVTPGRQRLKETFTLGDLMDYYYKNVKVARITRAHNANLGQMRYMLAGNRLDEILYAIDFAAATDQEVQIFDLKEFIPEARERVKINKSRMGEINR